MDELSVFIASTPEDAIPGVLRYACLKELFPRQRVLLLQEKELFLHESEPFISQSWQEQIARNLPNGVDVVFSSDLRAKELAARLGARFELIGSKLSGIPVSDEALLADPWRYQEFLPVPIRSFFVKKIVLTGPESVGKTVLAEKLAAHFNTAQVEEYGRTYTENAEHELTPIDFAHIAGGQIQLEDEAARKANRVLFCDTDLIITQIWGEIYFDLCPQWIIETNHQRHYDGFLLLAPDIVWKEDDIRVYGDRREEHFERLKDELVSRNLPFTIISGNYEERFEKAVRAVEEWIFPKYAPEELHSAEKEN